VDMWWLGWDRTGRMMPRFVEKEEVFWWVGREYKDEEGRPSGG